MVFLCLLASLPISARSSPVHILYFFLFPSSLVFSIDFFLTSVYVGSVSLDDNDVLDLFTACEVSSGPSVKAAKDFIEHLYLNDSQQVSIKFKCSALKQQQVFLIFQVYLSLCGSPDITMRRKSNTGDGERN